MREFADILGEFARACFWLGLDAVEKARRDGCVRVVYYHGSPADERTCSVSIAPQTLEAWERAGQLARLAERVNEELRALPTSKRHESRVLFWMEYPVACPHIGGQESPSTESGPAEVSVWCEVCEGDGEKVFEEKRRAYCLTAWSQCPHRKAWLARQAISELAQ